MMLNPPRGLKMRLTLCFAQPPASSVSIAGARPESARAQVDSALHRATQAKNGLHAPTMFASEKITAELRLDLHREAKRPVVSEHG
jgi:hypothetical protein